MQGRLDRLDDVAAGKAPTEFFYGAVELARAGIEVGHFEIDPEKGRGLLSAGIDLVQRLELGPYKTDGRTICQAAALSESLAAYDLVVATASKIAFAIAFCALAGRPRTPLLAIQCGLLNEEHNPVRRACMRFLMPRMHSMLFGESELAPMQKEFDCDAISVNQFGVDTDFWSPGGREPENLVLSIGNDGRRDFDTLLAAAPRIAAPIEIVTSRKLPELLPANVTVRRGSWHQRAFTDLELRDLYRRARCVVVPLIQSLQPSGQSVALQAMACGVPVILTDTEGLWSREMMVDQKNVLLCRAGDPEDLAAKVRRILEEPATAKRLGQEGRRTVCDAGNIRHFAARIEAFCRATKP